MNFNSSKYCYYLTPEKFETQEEFYTRGWIIAAMEPTTTKEMEEAVLYSRLYWNDSQGCCYGKSVEQHFKEWKEKYDQMK